MADINKVVLIKRDNLKVIRLQLKAGTSIPEHSTNAHVVIIPLQGQGILTINNTQQAMAEGHVLEMEPNAPHSVDAQTDLEFILVHMKLASNELTANRND